MNIQKIIKSVYSFVGKMDAEDQQVASQYLDLFGFSEFINEKV